MIAEVLPPAATPLGVWVRERLRDEPIAWLITVDSGGIAQPSPVWFVWEGDSVLVYNLPNAKRLLHIRERPHVTLHLDTYGRDGDAVVLVGEARIVKDELAADQHPSFLAKYGQRMNMGPKRWAEMFPIAVRIRFNRFRGFHQAGPGNPGV